MNDHRLSDVNLEITVVIGSTEMPIHQLLRMGRGAVIELDATTEDYVWILANNRLIARGEIMVNGENVAVQVTETIDLEGE
ncbi:MAG: FliM/FliN family flagellar motor switch protein [Alphaproteobacteria bacterium]|jgi:flagellar motor switch protein FliN/FliY|nr:FliM/FliN family flagellar motor switch protein [Alphaproteobacteria bacterium]MDP6875168.1 FliM/FliN family flagellar motor switch protein [Alphaproteobacteria bacterium]